MKIKEICVKYDPVKAPIRKFVVKLVLVSEHPPSVEKLVELVSARLLIAKAIWWLLLAFLGFGRSELDYNKA
ncbi:MAG: hypothetical protein Q8Q46_03245 [Candidatus Giovannonibacteria bacterium]|nr:hypothetical protein [Candidatus Giovannonibacteria bacterium]